MHIGLADYGGQPVRAAVRKVLPLARRLKERHGLEFFSLGGGLGIVYKPALGERRRRVVASPAAKGLSSRRRNTPPGCMPLLKPLGLRILIEPGASFPAARASWSRGSKYVKRTGRKNFLIVDAA